MTAPLLNKERVDAAFAPALRYIEKRGHKQPLREYMTANLITVIKQATNLNIDGSTGAFPSVHTVSQLYTKAIECQFSAKQARTLQKAASTAMMTLFKEALTTARKIKARPPLQRRGADYRFYIPTIPKKEDIEQRPIYSLYQVLDRIIARKKHGAQPTFQEEIQAIDQIIELVNKEIPGFRITFFGEVRQKLPVEVSSNNGICIIEHPEVFQKTIQTLLDRARINAHFAYRVQLRNCSRMLRLVDAGLSSDLDKKNILTRMLADDDDLLKRYDLPTQFQLKIDDHLIEEVLCDLNEKSPGCRKQVQTMFLDSLNQDNSIRNRKYSANRPQLIGAIRRCVKPTFMQEKRVELLEKARAAYHSLTHEGLNRFNPVIIQCKQDLDCLIDQLKRALSE